MAEQESKIYNYLYILIKLILILIPIALLVFLLKNNIWLGDKLEYKTDFSKKSPFISDFYPYGRAEIVDSIYEINLDPIYFDIYYPDDFDTAKLKIVYKNKNQDYIRVGLRQPGDWDYQFQTLEAENFKPKLVDGWREGEMIYYLENVSVEKNKIRFIISSPNLDVNGNKILIKNLGITFENSNLD